MFSTFFHDRRAARASRSIVTIVAVALIAAACTDGGSEESKTRPAGETTSLGRLVLMSDDGSALDGSLAVLTLTNTAGETFDVTVTGSGEATQEDVYLPAGDYVVSAQGDVHHSNAGSHSVAAIEPAEITVDPPGDDDPLAFHPDPAVVRFSLDTTPVPVKLLVEGFEPDEVALSWEAVDDVRVERYVLRLTEGDDPAESPEDGIAVDHAPDATSAVVDDLEPETTYTFTLFAETADGADIGFQSLTATTGSFADNSTAHALAPNTIVPEDHGDLDAQPLDNGRVGIVLSEDNDDRHSQSVVPGLDHDDLQEGCHPGLPILVSTDIAGEDAFYGVIESCPQDPPGWMRGGGDGAEPAVVNTDVPLAAVVQHLHVESYQVGGCSDESGAGLPDSDERCQFDDADEDGISDEVEDDLDLDAVLVRIDWNNADNLDLRVRCPGCDTFSVLEQGGNLNGNTARVVAQNAGDRSCNARDYREEAIAFNDATPGEWTVEVVYTDQPRQFEAGYCRNGVDDASLKVSVGGTDVISRSYLRSADRVSYSETFTIPEPSAGDTPPGFLPQRGTAATSRLAAKVKCESEGGSTFSPGFGFKPIEKSTLQLDGAKLSWDIRAGVEVAVDPRIKIEAGYKCSLDVDGKSFQLTNSPVPINLELTPLLEGSASGKIELTGPKLGIEFGMRTTGFVSASIQRCEIPWFPDPPCGITTANKVDVKPFGKFITEKATLKAEGELKLGVGVEANLGIGWKNTLATAKTGFAFGMKPAVAKVTGSVGVSAEMVAEAETANNPIPLIPPVAPTPPTIDKTWSFERHDKNVALSTGRHKVPYDGVDEVAPVLGAFVQTDSVTPKVECRSGQPPRVGQLTGRKVHYAQCGDALCMDAGENFGMGISTWNDACEQARCYFNRNVVSTGVEGDYITECPQTEAEAEAWAVYPDALEAYAREKAAYDLAKIAHDKAKKQANAAAATKELVAKLRACATIGLGAELSVDFVAEVFVLTWGSKRTYPIWDQEFDYPGAEFKIGDCIDD